MKFKFAALGTHWWIEVWDNVNQDQLRDIGEASYEATQNFEKIFSRFLLESDLSRLNQKRTLESSNQEFIEILEYGKNLYSRTDGVFNILVGHTLNAQGYGTASPKKEVVPLAGNPLRDIQIENSTIQLQGQADIDIGGFGKGWMIDKLAALFVQKFKLKEFLINGGGDIYATHQNRQPIELFLEDPQNPGVILASTHIKNQGFAGSSPHIRTWTQKLDLGATKKRTHIVSQTDQKLKDAVYLTAKNATEADAFATTFLQLDIQTAQKMAKKERLKILL